MELSVPEPSRICADRQSWVRSLTAEVSVAMKRFPLDGEITGTGPVTWQVRPQVSRWQPALVGATTAAVWHYQLSQLALGGSVPVATGKGMRASRICSQFTGVIRFGHGV